MAGFPSASHAAVDGGYSFDFEDTDIHGILQRV